MPRHLARAAAGQQRDDGPRRVQPPARHEFRAAHRRPHRAHQRMSDVFRVDPRLAEKIRFERKNAQHQGEPPAHQPHPPRPPRPELRADEVDVGHAARLEPPRQPQVEAGKINEDGERGAPFRFGIEQFSKDAANLRQAMQDFRDAEDADLARFGNQLHPRLAHVRAAQSEQHGARALAQRPRQTSGVQVARSFARGNQDLLRHHLIVGGNCRGGGVRANGEANLLILVLELVEAVVDAARGK
jgi:hypothetical protein